MIPMLTAIKLLHTVIWAFLAASARDIPSLSVREARVVRLMPSFAAAPCGPQTTQLGLTAGCAIEVLSQQIVCYLSK